MSKKCALLFVFVLVITATIQATPTTPIQATPTTTHFHGNVTIRYVYDGVPETWVSQLPETKTVEVTFNEDGWSMVDFKLMSYANVTMFGLQVDPPDPDDEVANFGGCQWEYWGSSWDDDSLLEVRNAFTGCTSVAPNTVIPVDVTMAYCSKEKEGLLCTKRGLTVFVANSYVRFSAVGAFRPLYREWVREVIRYKGGGKIPTVLVANKVYYVTTPKP